MSARAFAFATLSALLAGCPEDGSLLPPGDDDTPVGSDDDSTEPALVGAKPWLRDERSAPGSVTFHELHYHPPADPALEWIELHNPMAIDVDLSAWSLGGAVAWAFPEGTVIAAGGFLVIASDPEALATASGLSDALGPYVGQLPDEGARLTLTNHGGRLIDTVGFGQDEPWPAAPDGSGLTLAKIDRDAASDHAENWVASAEVGGTPGRDNGLDPFAPPEVRPLVPWDATWAYDVSGTAPDSDWTALDYDDAAWPRGQAVFFAGAAQEDAPATIRVTADNYYGLYLGAADGTDLRVVAADADGDWTSVESVETWVTPEDHLYLMAWEAPWDSGGPQMTIAEVELSDGVVGTHPSTVEWILGPDDGCPGTTPPYPPPPVSALDDLLDAANTDGSWAPPAASAVRSSEPWGWAVASSFADTTEYVWPDTLGDLSVTNTQNTYALFRSVEPLLGARGATELSTVPTTVRFRSTFNFDGDPGAATLNLAGLVDDGATVFLNGTELARWNMPGGAIDSGTLAASAVADAGNFAAALPAGLLRPGENVLAVELHQGLPDDLDLTFGAALTAHIQRDRTTPGLQLHELPPGGTTPFWVEVHNAGPEEQELGGLMIRGASGGGAALPEGTLAAGQFLVIEDLDPLATEAGDLLVLGSSDGNTVLDAARVGERLRGRAEAGGPWRFPQEPSPGAANVVSHEDGVVISEIQYHAAPIVRDGEPFAERDEEWIELWNRGPEPVDLGGWQLVDAVAFRFPAGTVLAPDSSLVVSGDAPSLRALQPGIVVLGDWDGRLDNGSDRILLLDAWGNPADEVRYFDGGRWPDTADGGGMTLELRDLRADNGAAESWAASDESAQTAWQAVTVSGVATSSAVGPDGTWHELVLGLLDAGEVLIDDVHVVLEPNGAATELVPNGTFDGGDGTQRWRLLGNHGRSEVVPDPEDPANPVLRLVASGPTGHLHNHAETTLLSPIEWREYEISFRARWVSGSNQLNSRLYFNRLARTTLLDTPDRSGTPGAPNSRAAANLGPSFEGLRQDLAVPPPGQPVRISVAASDPDGVAALTLWSSVEGGAWQSEPMTESETEPGRWEGLLLGEPAGTLVQFYVEGEDEAGAQAHFPARGPDSRALVRFDDGRAAKHGLHNLRILVTDADSDWLHAPVNLMSDEPRPGTVVYDERQVFYDVGVRTKGSERGRPEVPRLGYGLRFHRERPFRGTHGSVLVDRSQGVGFGQREVLLNLVMTRAGAPFAEYNDLAHAMTPLSVHTGPAELQLDRFTDLVLASQWEGGDDGALFEYELIYFPYTTDDGSEEGWKLPQPDSVLGTALTDLGDDKEAYRWTFLPQNNERRDDFTGLMALAQAFGTGGDFLTEAEAVIDTDEWLRAFAFATLSGAVDNYGSDGSQHNARFYVRPGDGRVLYFPHDLDFFGAASMPVVGNGDLARLLAAPQHRRAYYGHLQDILSHAYNEDYLGPWCDQLGALLPGQDFAGHCQFIEDRADWIMWGAPDAVMTAFPPLDFVITSEGGEDFETAGDVVVLEGDAWIDVWTIELDGSGAALDLSWIDERSWQLRVPMEAGPNLVRLLARDRRGDLVGSDEIVVTRVSSPN